jgi:uncharacterized membrane protein
MKESIQVRILAIILLVILALVDMIPYTSITALVGIVILLFKPKWFQKFINKVYS